AAQPRVPAEGAEAGQPGGRRRRRGRGGRGRRPGATVQGAADVGAAEGAVAGEPRPFASEGAGDERRRRRRRGRGRRDSALPEAAVPLETAPGEMPADYIPLQVERGMPVLYEPAERAVEEFEEEPTTPQKAKRVNSGKLFWYIRSKSYVPIP